MHNINALCNKASAVNDAKVKPKHLVNNAIFFILMGRYLNNLGENKTFFVCHITRKLCCSAPGK